VSALTASLNDKKALLALRPFYYSFGRSVSLFRPSVYCPGIGYIVNDAALAKTIMKDTENFSINEAGGLGTLIAELWGDVPTLLSMDGEEHKRVKFALLESFKEDNLKIILKHELAQLTKDLKKALSNNDEVDIARYTRLHTLRITSSILGRTDASDAELFEISDLVTKVMGCIKLTNRSYSRTDRATAEACVKEFKRIAKTYYESGSKNEKSLIAQLKKLGYSQEKTYGFISMFLVAGTVTVSSSFPRLVALLIDTGSFEKLKENPELIEPAINEAFRFITPGTTSLYGIKKTVTIDGREYRENRRVIISMYNILHDKRYTANPNVFDIQREQNAEIQGLWFGTGPHFCMGSVLAKLEIKSLLQMLIKLDGELHIQSRNYRKEGVYPSYENLLVTLSH